MNDDGSAWLPPVPRRTVIENSWVKLKVLVAKGIPATDPYPVKMQIKWRLEFKSTMFKRKWNIYLGATDSSGCDTGLRYMGWWRPK